MKLAVVGSRNFRYLSKVENELRNWPRDTTIISGGARGVDAEAKVSALLYGMPYLEFPVDKKGLPPYPSGRGEFARRAYARNTLIAEACDEMVAFWDGKSGGTKHAIKEARRLGKHVKVIQCVES